MMMMMVMMMMMMNPTSNDYPTRLPRNTSTLPKHIEKNLTSW
jgi:hypothetical protein